LQDLVHPLFGNDTELVHLHTGHLILSLLPVDRLDFLFFAFFLAMNLSFSTLLCKYLRNICIVKVKNRICMLNALMSCIGSIPNTQGYNVILYSLPVINLLRRSFQEQQWFQAAQASLAEPNVLMNVNMQRRSFQKDFNAGLVFQIMMACVTAPIIYSSQPRLLPLCAFVIFSINAAISLPYHWYQANFEIK
jgi:hypothetical protein